MPFIRVEVDGLNTGRFLDPPEFTVFHANGNEENAFDRVDYAFSQSDSVHFDFNYTRSWFQNPNAYDNLNVKELALYVQDQIKAGNWNFNLGIRGDLYNGLAILRQAEPRMGIAYHVQPTNTVAGSVPCYNLTDPNSPCGGITVPNGQPGVDLSSLTPDEEFQAGITCDGVAATPTSGFSSCDNAGYQSKLVQIPAPGMENDDHNPPRIAPRSLFDVSLG